MINPFADDDLILDGKFLSPENITLNPEQIERAIELSQSATPATQQWQTYLNVLALAGLERWLQKRAPELNSSREWLLRKERKFPDDNSMVKSPDATPNESFCRVKVNGFNIYLISRSILYDTHVSLAKTAVESPPFIPHFYVLVDILEEIGQANVWGYLRRDRFMQQRQTVGLPRESETTYLLPLEWFERECDRLLLYLRCLEPAAIPTESALRHSPLRLGGETPIPVKESAQSAINVRLWLKDQLDRTAQQLSWILLPPISLTSEFRPLKSPVEQLNDAIAPLLKQRSIPIPSQARGAYRDWQWENLALRLYVVTWELPVTRCVPEWTLLLILGAQPNATLPLGIKLQVRDNVQILEEPQLCDRSQNYLYARVIGSQNERFWVTIYLANGAAFTLPPFAFE
jgi:hypothetical protein